MRFPSHAKRLDIPLEPAVWTSGSLRLLVVGLAILGGCSRGLPTEYGKSKGRSGNESLNGFGTLRRSFEGNAWITSDVRRLNERLQPLDAILWTPTVHRTDESAAIDWFQQWLNERPRTLIYVLPDAGSELDYWQLASGLAPPEQRLEYRRRYARTLTRWMTARVDETSTIDRPWFRSQRRHSGSPGWEIVAHQQSAADEPITHGGPLHYQPLVADQGGLVRVMRIYWEPSASGVATRAAAPGASQILVVAGGSQVSNFALTQPTGREVAQTLLAQSDENLGDDAKRVGFLLSGESGVPISEPYSEPPTSAGMELLTVWPLSLVTMHLALMGIVACLILLPIFGRPRRLKTASASDFADHIHAVGALMNRSGGEAFARARISEYFRRVRGETAGKWVLPEPHPEPPPPPPHHPPHQSRSNQNDTLG